MGLNRRSKKVDVYFIYRADKVDSRSVCFKGCGESLSEHFGKTQFSSLAIFLRNNFDRKLQNYARNFSTQLSTSA